MLRSRIRFDTRATRIETATEGGGWLFEMYKLQAGQRPAYPGALRSGGALVSAMTKQMRARCPRTQARCAARAHRFRQ